MPNDSSRKPKKTVDNPVPGLKIAAPRRHKGDFLTPEVRSAVMARIKGKNTGPERAIAEQLEAAGLHFETHVRELPGSPDFVFRAERLVVFVDGDFWHGWRFPAWRDKLSEKWVAKIEGNRRRDARNHRKLRRQGWCVIRLWEHEVERDPRRCCRRISGALTVAERGDWNP